MSQVDHIYPIEDQHDHVLSENCVCGPELETITTPNGTRASVLIHHPIRVSIAELGRLLPDHLTWTEEPEARAGDRFVFRWAVVNEIWEGRPFPSTFPDVYVELTAHPKKRGDLWSAPIMRAGFTRPVYMKRGGGTTSNPLDSIDPDYPLEQVEKSVQQTEDEIEMRKARRRRPGKRERLRKAA
jgi:hypothetical protein